MYLVLDRLEIENLPCEIKNGLMGATFPFLESNDNLTHSN